jgi:hypothetical protein
MAPGQHRRLGSSGPLSRVTASDRRISCWLSSKWRRSNRRALQASAAFDFNDHPGARKILDSGGVRTLPRGRTQHLRAEIDAMSMPWPRERRASPVFAFASLKLRRTRFVLSVLRGCATRSPSGRSVVPRGGIELSPIELKLRHFSNDDFPVYPLMYPLLRTLWLRVRSRSFSSMRPYQWPIIGPSHLP